MSGAVTVTRDPQFWGLVDIGSPEDCWPWKGGLMSPKPAAVSGYGYYYTEAGRVPAHRHSLTLAKGGIAADLVVDHLCRNPCCVNPSHLEAIPNVENVMRGMSPPAKNARKTHCAEGHLLDDANVYLYRGRRHCQACKKERLKRVKDDPAFRARRAQISADYRARKAALAKAAPEQGGEDA